MGTEVFDLSWVQAVVKLFSLSGWSLFVVEKLLFDYYSIGDIKFYKLLKTPLCKVRIFITSRASNKVIGTYSKSVIL